MNLCAPGVPGGLIWQNANHHGDVEKTLTTRVFGFIIQAWFPLKNHPHDLSKTSGCLARHFTIP